MDLECCVTWTYVVCVRVCVCVCVCDVVYVCVRVRAVLLVHGGVWTVQTGRTTQSLRSWTSFIIRRTPGSLPSNRLRTLTLGIFKN